MKLDENLEGEDRRNFVIWCCEQTEKELMRKSSGPKLQEHLSFGDGLAESGSGPSVEFLQGKDRGPSDGPDSATSSIRMA